MKKNNRLIKCKNVMCGKEFTTRAGLRYHQRTSQDIDCQQAHSGAPLPLDFDAVVEKGEVLIFPKGKRGVPLLVLVQTENQMTEEFKCLVRGCGKSYPTRGGLRYHLLGCHRISSPVAAKLDVLCGKKRRQSEKILESVHFENYSDEHEHEHEDHEEEYNEHEDLNEHEDSDEMEEEEHMAQILMNAKNSYHNHHHTLKSVIQQTPMTINEIAPSISFNTKFDGKLPPLASLPSISKYLLVPSTNRPLSSSYSSSTPSYKTCNLPDSPTSSSSSSCLHPSMLPNMKEMFQFNKPYEKQKQQQQQQQQQVITGNGVIHPKPIKYSLSPFNSTT